MKKKILITSARSPVAVDMARQLHTAGHLVYTVDSLHLPVCRFSYAVQKNFVVPSPRSMPTQFIDKLVTIAKNEQIDLIIPMYEEIFYLAKEKDRFPKKTKIFAETFKLLNQLHNKWMFPRLTHSLGIEIPKTFLVRTPSDLENLDRSLTYAFKACYSRAGIGFKMIKPGEELPKITIEPNNPWIAQEWLLGQEYCSYSVCQKGKVLAHAFYPVDYTACGKGCIQFRAIQHPRIQKWVENFVEATQFTGQIAFDLIETNDGRLLAVECNPRSTMGALLFQNKDRLDRAFFDDVPSQMPIMPEEGFRKQLAIAMLIYGWRKSSHPQNSFKRFCKEFFGVRDVVLDTSDITPFLAQPISMLEICYHSLKSSLSLPAMFMFDSEWNGDMAHMETPPTDSNILDKIVRAP